MSFNYQSYAKFSLVNIYRVITTCQLRARSGAELSWASGNVLTKPQTLKVYYSFVIEYLLCARP